MNKIIRETLTSDIYALVIDENYRGKGYGTKLLTDIIKKFQKQKTKRVELDLGFHREGAHTFYQKFGFEKRAFLFSYVL